MYIGVVDATTTYDISTNLITVEDGENTLSSIYTDVNNESIFSLSDGVYTLDTNMVILYGATLYINDTTLSFNSSHRLWTRGYLYIENSSITSTNKTEITKRGYIMGRKLHASGDGGYILQIRNSTLNYLGLNDLDEWGEPKSGIFAYPPSTGEGTTDASIIIDNNNISNTQITSGEHSYPDYIRNNIFHDVDNEYTTVVNTESAIVDNNTFYDLTNTHIIFSLGYPTITNNTFYNIVSPDYGAVIRIKEGNGGFLISNNLIYDSSSGSAISQSASQRIAWSTVRDNIVHDFVGTGIRVTGNGYNDGTGSDTKVLTSYINNTIYNINSGEGGVIYLSHGSYFGTTYGAKHVLFDGNTVYNSHIGVCVEGDKYTNITFKNTNLYDNIIDIKYYDGSTSKEIAGNQTAKFINTNYNTLDIGGGTFNSYNNLDVFIEDINNNPVSGATVNITNDINNAYPSININEENKTSFTTQTDGHIPLPIGNESNSAAVLDFVKTPTQEIQMSYTIEVSYQGHSSSITGVNPESSWYRTNPNTYDNTIAITLMHPRWDVNEDGTVNILDISLIGQKYGTSVEAPYPRWDVNQDGVINVQDMTLVAYHFGEIVA